MLVLKAVANSYLRSTIRQLVVLNGMRKADRMWQGEGLLCIIIPIWYPIDPSQINIPPRFARTGYIHSFRRHTLKQYTALTCKQMIEKNVSDRSKVLLRESRTTWLLFCEGVLQSFGNIPFRKNFCLRYEIVISVRWTIETIVFL